MSEKRLQRFTKIKKPGSRVNMEMGSCNVAKYNHVMMS